MAVFRGDFRSQILEEDMSLQVILPYDRLEELQTKECPVLYLLHGLKQNSSGWLRHSQIEELATQAGIAVVVPEVHRSFYTNMKYGGAYFDYVAKELPELCCRMFHISPRREDTFVAGLSMGGYGALKVALRCPERFAVGAGFSSVMNPLDYTLLANASPICLKEAVAIWGEEPKLSAEDDLALLAAKVAQLPAEQRPRIYSCCGTEDYLYPQNLTLRQTLEALPLDYRYEQWPGIHDWNFWREAIRRFFEYYIIKQ